MYVNKSSVTRQLSLLEQNGFIRREPCEEDRRQLRVFPTEKAFEIFPKVVEVRQSWNERLLSGFSEEEKETLSAMMERVMERAEEILQDADEGGGNK